MQLAAMWAEQTPVIEEWRPAISAEMGPSDWLQLADQLHASGFVALESIARRLAERTLAPVLLFSGRLELSAIQAEALIRGRRSDELVKVKLDFEQLLGASDALTSFQPLSSLELADIAWLALFDGLLPEFILTFDHRYYYSVNRSSFPAAQGIPPRAALITDFIQRGLSRGFRFSDGEAVDPPFYAETYGLRHTRTHAILTRHWMSGGIALGFSPNVDHWLARKEINVFGRLGSVHNIDLVRAVAPYRGEAAGTTSWTDAAEHLFAGGRIDHNVLDPLSPQGACFLLSVATYLDQRSHHEAADRIIEFLCESPHVGSEARVAYAQRLRHRKHPLSALFLLHTVVNGGAPERGRFSADVRMPDRPRPFGRGARGNAAGPRALAG